MRYLSSFERVLDQPTDLQNEKLASLAGAGSLGFLVLQFELGHKVSQNITCQKIYQLISRFSFLIWKVGQRFH
jgi:hypothetical protein